MYFGPGEGLSRSVQIIITRVSFVMAVTESDKQAIQNAKTRPLFG